MKKSITKAGPTCSICGKPLENPLSVELGIGPECRLNKKLKELGEKTGNLFANRAEYDYGFDGNILWIEDLLGLKSVTNDMENILADILKTDNIELCRYKIIYQDSQGIWDGVKISSSGSIQFYSIGEKKQHHAKQRLLEMNI